MRVALRLRAPVVGDVHLAADDGLDAGRPRLPVELDRAGERAVVGERDGRHLETSGLLDERRDPARPVEDRVLRVDVEMDERSGGRLTGGPSYCPGPTEDSLRRDFRTPRYAASPDQSWSASERQVSRRSARPVTRWSSQ